MDPENIPPLEATLIPLGSGSVHSIALGSRPYLSVEIHEDKIALTVAGVEAGQINSFLSAVVDILDSVEADPT